MPADYRLQNDPYVGFHAGRMQLPRERKVVKIDGEDMKDMLFSSWLEKNSE